MSQEEAIAKQIAEDERIMRNPLMRAIFEENKAKAKQRESDPHFQPGRLVKEGWDSTFKKKKTGRILLINQLHLQAIGYKHVQS